MHIYLHSKCNDCVCVVVAAAFQNTFIHSQNGKNQSGKYLLWKIGWLSIQVDLKIRVKSKNKKKKRKRQSKQR